MGIKKEFSKDVLIYGLGRGIQKFIGLFLLPFYTRALSPEEYGILDTLATFAVLSTAFLNMAIDSASGFYFFKAKSDSEKKAVLSTVFFIRIFTIIPALLLSFFSQQISLGLFQTADYSWVVFITCLSIPISLLLKEQGNVYRYYREPTRYNIVVILKSILGIVMGLLLVVFLKYGVLGAQLATLLSSLVVILFSIFVFTKNRYSFKFSWFWAKKMIKYGFPIMWAGLAAWVYSSSNRIFLLHYRDLTEIGYYSIGNTLSQPIQLINMAVQMSFGVLIFSLYHDDTSKGKTKTKKAAVDMLNMYLSVAIPLAVIISIFSIDLINLITPSNYLSSALVIPFLTFAAIARLSFQVTGPGIEISQKTWHFTWITVLTAVINVGLNFYFIPKWGFIGAAGTTLISLIFMWVIKYVVSQRFFHINYRIYSIAIYFILGLLIALSCPFLELIYDIKISITIKIVLSFIGMSLPIIFRLLSVSDINRYYQKLKQS